MNFQYTLSRFFYNRAIGKLFEYCAPTWWDICGKNNLGVHPTGCKGRDKMTTIESIHNPCRLDQFVRKHWDMFVLQGLNTTKFCWGGKKADHGRNCMQGNMPIGVAKEDSQQCLLDVFVLVSFQASMNSALCSWNLCYKACGILAYFLKHGSNQQRVQFS